MSVCLHPRTSRHRSAIYAPNSSISMGLFLIHPDDVVRSRLSTALLTLHKCRPQTRPWPHLQSHSRPHSEPPASPRETLPCLLGRTSLRPTQSMRLILVKKPLYLCLRPRSWPLVSRHNAMIALFTLLIHWLSNMHGRTHQVCFAMKLHYDFVVDDIFPQRVRRAWD